MGIFSSLNYWFLLSFLFPNSSLGGENDTADSSSSIANNPCTCSCNNKSNRTTTANSPAEGTLKDRLSILPDGVAHRIFSLLSQKDVIRLGAASKRCRELFLSLPYLNFDLATFPRDSETQVKRLNCLDKYMVLRGDNKLLRFRIHWPSFVSVANLEHFRIISWIHNAVRCNVAELAIDCNKLGLRLPSCIFCPSLRSLLVDLHRMILKLPLSPVSCNLQYLKLKDVRILDQRFCDWISDSCNCIKELVLIRVKGMANITIKSSSLESLELVSGIAIDLVHLRISGEKLQVIHLHWSTSFPLQRSKSLEIAAPNLKRLRWEVGLVHSQNLGEFMSLERAEIFVGSVNKLVEVFPSICRAKVLILDDWTTKALFREGSIPPLLDHTCHLGLHLESLSDEIVPTVASLLGGMPNLNTLYIKSQWSRKCLAFGPGPRFTASSFDAGYWESQNLVFIHQLEEVTIQPSINRSNELELARYILEHAPKLKKMVILIHLASKQSNDVVRMLRKCKMASTAKVVIDKK